MANDCFDNVIEELSDLFEAMTGINQAPEHPPEGVNDPPMVVTYYVETDVEYSLTYSRTLSTVYADVLLARAPLPHIEAQARKYIRRGIVAVAGAVTLNSDATHCLVQRVLGPRMIPYQGLEFFGVRYVIEVKIVHSDLGVAA